MNKFLKYIYYKSSGFLQNIYCSLYGLYIIKDRYNSIFEKYFKESFNSYSLTSREVKENQRNKLKILLFVASKSKFWNKRFKFYNIDIFSADPIKEIKKLPILTRNEVKDNLKDILINKKYLKLYTKSNLKRCSTSGTTGSGLIFFETSESQAMRWSIWWRYRALIGINRGMWCGLFGGRSLISPKDTRPPFWRINLPGKQVLFSTFHISENNSIYYFNEIKKRKLKWLHGYPSALSLLASYALKNKIDGFDDLQIITTGAENLFHHQKWIIEKAFNVPVMDHYGQAEGVANFSQTDRKNYLVDEDFSIVEFISTNQKYKYKIVGTSLHNLAFPLIRYDTQDIAHMKNLETEFNEKWRKVHSIDGRSEDYILLKDGSKAGRLDQLFKDLVDIVEAQFVQNEPGKVELFIVPSINFNNNSLDKLNQLFYEKFYDRLELNIHKVKNIKRSENGKLRFVKSKYKI